MSVTPDWSGPLVEAHAALRRAENSLAVRERRAEGLRELEQAISLLLRCQRLLRADLGLPAAGQTQAQREAYAKACSVDADE